MTRPNPERGRLVRAWVPWIRCVLLLLLGGRHGGRARRGRGWFLGSLPVRGVPVEHRPPQRSVPDELLTRGSPMGGTTAVTTRPGARTLAAAVARPGARGREQRVCERCG